jgi:hypothetical protein
MVTSLTMTSANSSGGTCEYATLMLKASRLCETIRVALRCLLRLCSPEFDGVVAQAQPRIAVGIRQASGVLQQALELPLPATLNTDAIRNQELRDGVALEQFQAAHAALGEELDRIAKHPGWRQREH